VVHGRATYRSRQAPSCHSQDGRRVRFYILDDAITLLPQTKLCKLIARYLNPVELRPDGAGKEDL
jgi:hypothetical protein